MPYNPSTFCAAPYVELRINSNGSINFCHAANGKNIPDIDYISNVTVDEYFNQSSTVTNIRQLFEAGQESTKCSKCYSDERLNVVSHRNRRNMQYGIFPDKDFDQSLQESSLWQTKNCRTKPNFYHVSFSNICNMACLMCHPEFSSLLTTTLKQAKLIDSNTPVLHDWTQGPAWDLFCEHLCNNDDIVCLHIMGGEPLYHKRFKELLVLLNQRNHTNFHFTFVTNGSIYSPEIIDLLKNFKSVTIEISIEGVTLANDYIRHTSNTLSVLDNIIKWSSHRSDTFDVVLRSVPQALSVIDYDKLLEFALKHSLLIDSNMLESPAHLKANILPANIKTAVRNKLNKFISGNIEFDVSDINLRDTGKVNKILMNNALAVIAHMDSPCQDISTARQLFVDYCSQYDRARNINIKDFIPELLEFMNEYNYEQKLSAN